MPACNSPKGLPAEITRGMALLMCALSCAWQPSMAGAPPVAPPRPVIMTAPSWYELEDDLDAENFDEDDPRIWFLPPTSNFIFMPDFGSSTFVPRKSDRVPKPTNLDMPPAPQPRNKPKHVQPPQQLIDTAITSGPEPLQPTVTVVLPPHGAPVEPFQPDLPEPAPVSKSEPSTSRRGRTVKRYDAWMKDFVMVDDGPDAADEPKAVSRKHKRRSPAKKAPALLQSDSSVSAPACPPHIVDSDFAQLPDRRKFKSSSKRRRDEDSSGDEELPSKRRAVVPPTPATSPSASPTPASAESPPTPSVLLHALSSASSMSLTSDSSASSAPPSAPTVDLAPLKAMRTASRRASRKAGANPY